VHAPLREALYRDLIALRQAEIVVRLDGARALDAKAVGLKAVVARWRMGDGAVLTLASNLDNKSVSVEPLRGRRLFAPSDDAAAAALSGTLSGYSTCVWLEVADRAANE
jgi:maltooligosyltrehalose trehalohydrolase